MDETVGYGPRPGTSRYYLSPSPVPGTDQTTVQVRYLSPLWIPNGYFHHYTLSHTPLSDPELVINSLIHGSPQIFVYAMQNIICSIYIYFSFMCIYTCPAISWLSVHQTLNFELELERSVCSSHLTSGASVCPEIDVTYILNGQRRSKYFFETAPLQRYTGSCSCSVKRACALCFCRSNTKGEYSGFQEDWPL